MRQQAKRNRLAFAICKRLNGHVLNTASCSNSRASTRLARLWRDQGRAAEAHELLAPVYGWFTEGRDAPDLKEASALLDDLVVQ